MVCIVYIFIVSIMLYLVVLYHVSYIQVYMSSNVAYTDITPHNWTQAVESFELNYDFMHMYYWKFNLHF